VSRGTALPIRGGAAGFCRVINFRVPHPMNEVEQDNIAYPTVLQVRRPLQYGPHIGLVEAIRMKVRMIGIGFVRLNMRFSLTIGRDR
jgi:hypothetical protein